jgi:hypothetical protein
MNKENGKLIAKFSAGMTPPLCGIHINSTAQSTHRNFFFFFFFLSLAPQPSLGLGLLHKIRLNFLEASQQFSFLQGRVVSPTPNTQPGGTGLSIYISQRQGGPVIPPGTGYTF